MNQNLHVNKTNFYMKGSALDLALKQRCKGNLEVTYCIKRSNPWGLIITKSLEKCIINKRNYQTNSQLLCVCSLFFQVYEHIEQCAPELALLCHVLLQFHPHLSLLPGSYHGNSMIFVYMYLGASHGYLLILKVCISWVRVPTGFSIS